MKMHSDRGRHLLSDTLLPGQPLTEIVGNKRVLIENHKGIVAYGCNEICVKTSAGMIRVEGSAMELNCISKDKVVITGQIACVCFCNGG